MPKSLLIFIDGFPYSFLCETNFMQKEFVTLRALTPGLGYSVNVHSEIFMGANPDEVGYLNTWKYKKETKIFKPLEYFRFIFNERGRFPVHVIDRKIHSLFDRVGLKVANIPFPYRYLFERSNICNSIASSKFKNNSILATIPNIQFCISETIREEPGFRDAISFKLAQKAISNDLSVFVTFVDLDSVSHRFGVGSTQHINRIKQLDYWVEELVQEFLKHGGNNQNIFIFSDHGMTNVSEVVDLIPEKILGLPSHQGYAYFTDSTILRIWITQESIRTKAEKYIENLQNAHLLTNEERLQYGVQSLDFGDYILILNEGKIYNPNFVSRGVPLAMHGYLPNLESQKGIFLTSNKSVQVPLHCNTLDLFLVLKEFVLSNKQND